MTVLLVSCNMCDCPIDVLQYVWLSYWCPAIRVTVLLMSCNTCDCPIDYYYYYYYYYYWSLLYSAILRSRADSLRSHVILHEWIAFYSTFLNIHRSGVLTALAWLVPQESAARESQSRRVLCAPYNHAPCHFMQSHIRKVYACLAVTCHLRFWQNDRGLLRATAVTRGWNGYRNKSQHRKLTLEKKILPPLQQGFEPATFQSRVRYSNHWVIPDPQYPIDVDILQYVWLSYWCPARRVTVL